MARQQKTDRELQTGRVRLARLKSIDKSLDLGGGVSVVTLGAALDEAAAALDAYNEMLAMIDEKLNVYKAKVKVVNDLSRRSLSGVESKYGADSDEYEKAGGVRSSERKKTTRKPTP